MPKGDHCAVFGCSNDRRYPEKQVIKPHVGVLRFYTPLNPKDASKWEKLINRRDFKVKLSTKVCSNHFKAGYRSKDCPNPTLYLKGYDSPIKCKRRACPRERVPSSPKPAKRRKVDKKQQTPNEPCIKNTNIDEEAVSEIDTGNIEDDLPDTSVNLPDDENDKICEKRERRRLFIAQATCEKNCFRYTGITRPKLDLVFDLVKEKTENLRYWRGSVKTPPSRNKKKKGKPRILTPWEEFVLTLVRTRKGFDVHFLADTFGITAGHVSRVYNTWITLLSSELSFLVPWPTKQQIRNTLPKRFKKFPDVRVIVDCCEFYIQKPTIPESQKSTWSSYKSYNTVKLLVGITPTGVFSFIPPLWTGSISDKEIVKKSGLINYLEEGDAVMADKGFLVRDLLAFKKVKLISPAYCHGPRLSSKAVTHTRRVAALRSHVECAILRLKHFRILSGVVPVLLKMVLDRIVFLCAALANLNKRLIK